MARSNRQFVAAVRRGATEAGWTMELNRKHHYVLRPPAGALTPAGSLARQVVLAGSPSDHRSTLNALSQLRRQGIPVQWRSHP